MRSAEAMTEPRQHDWALAQRPERDLEQLARRLEVRVPGMRGHSRRVAVYAALTAKRMGLDNEQVGRVRRAAAIHDIGKVEVPAEMLNRSGPVGDEEFARIQAHATAGARIVSVLGDAELTAIVRHHHERWDGEGYPDHLGGAEIPLGARIVAVADTFDAVTTTRPYRPALEHGAALDLLEREAGGHLDPRVVAAFRVHCSGLRGVLMAVRSN
jgi:putative nucleotidyltransferase with HDIG domain